MQKWKFKLNEYLFIDSNWVQDLYILYKEIFRFGMSNIYLSKMSNVANEVSSLTSVM